MGEIIVGKNPIIEALRSGRSVNKVFIAKGLKDAGRILDLCRIKSCVFEFVDRSYIDKTSNTDKNQGVMAFLSSAEYVDIEDLFSFSKEKNENLFIILLDQIEDPHNLGAILRTCDAAGAHGVVITKRRSAKANETVAKTSAGAVSYVPIAMVSNLNDTILKLKERRVWVIGLDGDADIEFTKADLKLPIAIVVGGEGKGLSHLVKRNCDFLVKIPMKGQISSLNASVASAVLMYEVVKQRSGV